MKTIILFLFCVSLSAIHGLVKIHADVCGVQSEIVKEECEMRISGGVKIKQVEFPWLVAFVSAEEKNFFCAGSLISAKHCLSGKNCKRLFSSSRCNRNL